MIGSATEMGAIYGLEHSGETGRESHIHSSAGRAGDTMFTGSFINLRQDNHLKGSGFIESATIHYA